MDSEAYRRVIVIYKRTKELLIDDANQYVNRLKGIKNTRNNSIMFLGRVGSGKTNLSLATANKLMDNCVGVLYMSYREAIAKIKQNAMDS